MSKNIVLVSAVILSVFASLPVLAKPTVHTIRAFSIGEIDSYVEKAFETQKNHEDAFRFSRKDSFAMRTTKLSPQKKLVAKSFAQTETNPSAFWANSVQMNNHGVYLRIKF